MKNTTLKHPIESRIGYAVGANDIYAGMKLGSNVEYTAPELIPHIQSDQVRAICLALCEMLSEGEDK